MSSELNTERRRDQRSPQSGAIEIFFEDPRPVKVSADLIEISERGFRAAHDEKALAPGLQVEFKRGDAQQRARVIWTHILEGRCVSGFLIL